MRLLKVLCFFFVFALMAGPAMAERASSESLYDDPRIEKWSEYYLKGDYTKVIKLVEKDLLSKSPHEFSPFIWTRAHFAEGSLEKVLGKKMKEKLKTAIGPMADIYYLYAIKDDDRAVIDKYTPSKVKGLKDPWALITLRNAANEVTNDEYQMLYMQELVSAYPNFFMGHWRLSNLLDNESNRKAVMDFLQTIDPQYRVYLEDLNRLPVGDGQRVDITDRWLAKDPFDAMALTYRGLYLEDLSRYEEAAEAIDKAARIFPFYNYETSRSEYLARAGMLDEARESAERSIIISPSRNYQEDEDKDVLVEVRYAEALAGGGEKGEARKVFDGALERWPDHAGLNYAMADFEYDGDRAGAALSYIKKAIEVRPLDIDYQVLYIKILTKENSFDEAIKAYEFVKEEGIQKNVAFYIYGGRIFVTQENYDKAVEVDKEGLGEFPQSSWLQRELADVLYDEGRYTESIKAINDSFEVYYPDSWAAGFYKRLYTAAYDSSRAAAELKTLRGKYPWIKHIWKKEAELLGDTESKEKMWKEAIKGNPSSDWAYEGLIELYLDLEDFDKALVIADESVEAAKNGTIDDMRESHIKHAWIMNNMINKGAFNEEGVENVFMHLEKYREFSSDMHLYYYYKSQIHEAMGEYKEAAEYAAKRYEAMPDSSSAKNRLFDSHVHRELSSKAFVYLDKYIKRDPYNGGKLVSAAHLHIKWGGSPIVGIQLIELVKERDPDEMSSFARDNEVSGYNSLGAKATYYVQSYGDVGAISNSDRYIGWYESARRDAQEGDSTKIVLGAPGEVKIYHTNGMVVERKDHPISGKMMDIKVGLAFIKAEYNEDGTLVTALKSSSGAEAYLDYNEKEEIVWMRVDDGTELTFEYNENSKPIKIAIEGVGYIDVEYDDFGEMSNVDSPGGHTMALRVTQAFQRLLSVTKLYERVGYSTQVPMLPFEDVVLEGLEEDAYGKAGDFNSYEDDETRKAFLEALLKLGEHLKDNLGAKQSYSDDGKDALGVAIEVAKEGGEEFFAYGITAADIYFELLKEISKDNGFNVSKEDFLAWSEVENWLILLSEDGFTDAGKLLKRVKAEPLHLQEEAKWAPASYLTNPGYWNRWSFSEIMPKGLAGNIDAEDILVRGNGDVVIGTDKGIVVFKDGFWRWYGFDTRLSAYSSSVESGKLDATSKTLSLIEDSGGVMWVGTAKGLIKIGGNYDDKATVYKAEDRNMSLVRFENIAPSTLTAEDLYIGNGKDLYILKDGLFGKVVSLESKIEFMEASRDGKLLIGTQESLVLYEEGNVSDLETGYVRDAIWEHNGFGDGSYIYYMKNNSVYGAEVDDNGSLFNVSYMPGQQDIVYTHEIYGLSHILMDSGYMALAVNTDMGISVYGEEHFEYIKLPLADKTVGVRAVDGSGGDTYMLTTEGVYASETGRINSSSDGRISDILTNDREEITFIARNGMGIEMVRNDEFNVMADSFSYFGATLLADDGQSTLIAAGGTDVVRFTDSVGYEYEELFSCYQTGPDGETVYADISSLLVDSKGVIWTVAGASVCKWEDGIKEEFSIYVDSETFPARSDMISKVVETIDGKIWVVASNERHRQYNGMRLSGGLLEWAGDGFKMLDDEMKTNNWFITGYTKIDDSTAIAGSTKGFIRHSNGKYESYRYGLKDSTYLKLFERTPQLWLGTDGARLGEDTWLFGTGGGLVAYKGGMWFYPDRINWMLPDQQLSLYGSRKVHAVDTDKYGNIYAGTDRGLLIYRSGGDENFLFANGMGDLSFSYAQEQTLRRQADILLSSLGEDTEMYKQIKTIKDAGVKIVNLKEDLAVNTKGMQVKSAEEIEKINKDLQKEEKRHKAMLARLERKDPALYQMLEVKPLDIASMKEKLGDNQVVLQFLPTEDRLFILILKKDKMEIRKVDVSREMLDTYALDASYLLKESVGTDQWQETELTAKLSWLYDHLLRPVENAIDGYEHVFVVPVGPLNYIPFAALVRSADPKIEYAVERNSFGYLPTMYLMNLMFDHTPSLATESLVFGDPDGSLEYARAEARTVAALLDTSIEPKIGSDATYDTLIENAADARIIHFATHGKLNTSRPEKSYLLLADDHKLTFVDIMILPLDETDLVVLSACETGKGKDGMEYATLARSFAHAGVSSVVATLWEVEDESSSVLIEDFYKNLNNGSDVYSALSGSQRTFLSREENRNVTPANWSGYIPFGRP